MFFLLFLALEDPVLKLETLSWSWWTCWLVQVLVLILDYSKGNSYLCASPSEFYHHIGLLSLLVFICSFSLHAAHYSFNFPLIPKTLIENEIRNSWQLIRSSDFIQTRFAHGTGRKWTRHKSQPFPHPKPWALLWLPSHSLRQQTACFLTQEILT